MARKICLRCQSRSSDVSGIIAGVYYKELCRFCLLPQVSSGEASYNRQRDLEDHLADIAQPYVGGKPNPDFIRIYPDKARAMFSADELRKYG
jgi:hypothetical protein